jgi:hypothetical protein
LLRKLLSWGSYFAPPHECNLLRLYFEREILSEVQIDALNF